jgi:RNA polymerase sigma-70 factor (ECF subfamily)
MYSDDSQPTSLLPQTDAELFQAVKAGQQTALGLLYDRYAKPVYGLALHILKQPQEAEDLTQEIFLTFWRGSSYNPERGSIGQFLMLLARSRAIDKLRSRNNRFRFLMRWQQSLSAQMSPDPPLENASHKELATRVQQALADLPTDRRQVLELAYYGGLSQSEIAQRLNLPLGTVKTRSRQGLLKLRQALEDFV